MTDTTGVAAAEAAPELKTENTPVEQESTETQAEPAKTETPAGSDEETGDEAAEEGKPRKKGGGFQKRISELTTERYQAEARAREAERKLQEYERKANPAPSDPGDMPKLESFTTLEDHQKAVVKWRDDSVAYARQQAKDEAAREIDRRTEQQKIQAIQSDISRRANLARVKHPDFDAVLQPMRPIIDQIPALVQFVAENEPGVEVAYELAKNPAMLMDIAKMPQTQALRELIKLEARLTAPPPPKKLTNAPDPIKPVGANEKVARSYADMPMEEYARMRREERRKSKG